MTVRTTPEVYDALVHGITVRWPMLREGEQAPTCQLCEVCETIVGKNLPANKCTVCPLADIGDVCYRPSSVWAVYCTRRFNGYSVEQACDNMIARLQECLDTYFPDGRPTE